MKKPTSVFLFVTFLALTIISGCKPAPSPTPPTPSPIPPTMTSVPDRGAAAARLQEGNSLPIGSLVLRQSRYLVADTRLGWGLYSSNIWNDIPNLEDLINDYTNFGIKRLDTSMQEIEPPIDWYRNEFEISPHYDRFIDDLNENGIAVNYMLHFWDKDGHANGKELTTPRFQSEEQIQDFIAYIRFVVSSFRGRVQYYTLWSEPNYCGDSGIKCIKVQDYIKLARRTIPVIKEEDPEAKVVMAPYTPYYDREDMLTIFQSDVIPMFDVISWHGIYNSVPDSEFYGNYYYEYPEMVEEFKQTAHAHGFDGEFWAPEISWCSADYPTCYSPDRPYKIIGSDKIAAKYDARSFILHLGMDIGVGWGGLESVDAPWTYPTVQRLNTVMAGAEPINYDVQIENESSDNSTYAFTLPNGDMLFAFWTDGVATDDDPSITCTLTFPDKSAERVIGIDVLNGFEQEIVIEMKNGNLVIHNLFVRDYPIIIKLIATMP